MIFFLIGWFWHEHSKKMIYIKKIIIITVQNKDKIMLLQKLTLGTQIYSTVTI